MEKFIQDTLNVTGISLSPRQVKAFQVYEEELISWNEKFNLTAIREPEGIRTKHFLDSLTVFSEIGLPFNGRIIDVGTGAGFPGIALKIVASEARLTLVESVGKKAEFCRHMVEILGLQNVDVLTNRAEEIGITAGHRETYDWAVARAVASMPVLAEYLLPLVKLGGAVLAQKGESAHAEVQNAEKAIRILGGKLRRVTRVALPGVADERYLVVIDKQAATPPQYPRGTGIPSKKPL